MLRDRSAGVGLGLALISAASFGTSGSFARSLTEAGWSPAAAVTVRIGLAALLLIVPTVVMMRGRWHALRRNLGMVSAYGMLAVAGCQVFFFNAVQTLSVGVALLLEYLGTILVVGWVWLRHGNPPRRLTILGAAVAVIGLVLVLNLIGGTKLDLVGVLWGLGAAVGLAVYFVLSSKVDDELPPLAMASAGMSIGTLALIVFGLFGGLPMHATFDQVSFAGRLMPWWVPILGLAVIAAALAYVVGIAAARMLGPRLASFAGLTEVAFAVLIAWLVLGELPTPIQLVGGVFIVGGVVLVRIDELRPAVVLQKGEDRSEVEPVASGV